MSWWMIILIAVAFLYLFTLIMTVFTLLSNQVTMINNQILITENQRELEKLIRRNNPNDYSSERRTKAIPKQDNR